MENSQAGRDEMKTTGAYDVAAVNQTVLTDRTKLVAGLAAACKGRHVHMPGISPLAFASALREDFARLAAQGQAVETAIIDAVGGDLPGQGAAWAEGGDLQVARVDLVIADQGDVVGA